MNDVELLYSKAREAKQKEDFKTSYEIYKEINEISPNSWEAIFNITYFKAMQASIKGFWSTSIEVMNVERDVFELIKKDADEKEQSKAVETVCSGLRDISRKFTHNAKQRFSEFDHNLRDEYISEYVSIISAAAEIQYSCGDNIIASFNNKYQDFAVGSWKKAIDINCSYTQFVINKKEQQKTINKYGNKILEFDKSYVIPKVTKGSDSNSFTGMFRRIFHMN